MVFGPTILEETGQEGFGLFLVLKAHQESSSLGELHPQALRKPDVNLSIHPAPIVQPRDEGQFATERTD